MHLETATGQCVQEVQGSPSANKGQEQEKELGPPKADGWWLDEPGLEYHDPHPTVLWVGPGVWSLPGRKEAFFMVPAKNSCTNCPNRTKSSWCSHLVSAGLRAGKVYKSKVFKLPLSKVFKKQNP